MNLLEKGIVAGLMSLGIGATLTLGNRVLTETESLEKQQPIEVSPQFVEELQQEQLKEEQQARLAELKAERSVRQLAAPSARQAEEKITTSSIKRPGVYYSINGDEPQVVGDTPEASANRLDKTTPSEVIETNTRPFSPKIAPVVTPTTISNVEYEKVWKKLSDMGIPVSQFTDDTGIKINPDYSVTLDGKTLSPSAFECYVNGYVPNMKHIKPNCGW